MNISFSKYKYCGYCNTGQLTVAALTESNLKLRKLKILIILSNYSLDSELQHCIGCMLQVKEKHTLHQNTLVSSQNAYKVI